jgi:hypothetical protein
VKVKGPDVTPALLDCSQLRYELPHLKLIALCLYRGSVKFTFSPAYLLHAKKALL